MRLASVTLTAQSAARRFLILLLLVASLIFPAAYGGRIALADDALLAQDLSAILTARTARIDPYVAWTYGWVTSYANSYKAAYHILSDLWSLQSGQGGDPLGVLRSLQQKSLRERVSQPADDAARISKLIDRHAEAKLYVLSAQALSAACTGKVGPDCVPQALPAFKAEAAAIIAERREAASRAQETRQLTEMLEFRQTGNIDILHAMRPITTRVAVVILRFTEFASIVLLVTSSLRRAYIPDIVITRFAVALAVSWSLDYALLQVERALNEDSFRAALEAQMSAQEGGIRQFVHQKLSGYESRFNAAVVAIGRRQG